MLDTPEIQRFLKRCKTEATRKSYLSALKGFFVIIDKSPKTYFDKPKNDKSYRYDLEDFADSLKNNPPKTVNMYLAAINKLFEREEIEIPVWLWKDLRSRGSRAVTQDRIPTKTELRLILNESPLRMQALILSLVSSGARISEMNAITLDEIDMDSEPVKIDIRAEITKTKIARYTFISSEAKKRIEQWLPHRDEYLIHAAKINNLKDAHGNEILKNTQDNRLFPWDKQSSRHAFNRALDKCKLDMKDKVTHRRLIHLHSLRKFTRTRLPLGGMPTDMIEHILGHSGYLTDAYVRLNSEEVARAYLKAQDEVTIGETSKANKQLQKELESLRNETDMIRQELEDEKLATKIMLKHGIPEDWYNDYSLIPDAVYDQFMALQRKMALRDMRKDERKRRKAASS